MYAYNRACCLLPAAADQTRIHQIKYRIRYQQGRRSAKCSLLEVIEIKHRRISMKVKNTTSAANLQHTLAIAVKKLIRAGVWSQILVERRRSDPTGLQPHFVR